MARRRKRWSTAVPSVASPALAGGPCGTVLYHTDSHSALARRISLQIQEVAGRMAGGPGFEPRLPGSEPGVLPLNYPPFGVWSWDSTRRRRAAIAARRPANSH